MSRNLKNILKFLIAVAALALFAFCVCQKPEDFSLWHIAGIVVSIIVGAWYVWHVFTDK